MTRCPLARTDYDPPKWSVQKIQDTRGQGQNVLWLPEIGKHSILGWVTLCGRMPQGGDTLFQGWDRGRPEDKEFMQGGDRLADP